MDASMIKGRVHSFQSLGTVDGPGVRFVVFLSGCPLRCSCCHNPDTWDINAGSLYSAEQIVTRAEKFREYFGDKGGITLSGGEPLCQAELVSEVFRLCRERGINTCLDTSGVYLNDSVKEALEYSDRVLLDLKYATDELYRRHVGMPLSAAERFLDYLNEKKIPTTLRQVCIPTVNDDEQSRRFLVDAATKHPCVDKLELLPFRKICQVKYDAMNIPFPLSSVDAADAATVASWEKELNDSLYNT